jgi:glutamate synthase domain-containing protein 2
MEENVQTQNPEPQSVQVPASTPEVANALTNVATELERAVANAKNSVLQEVRAKVQELVNLLEGKTN